MWSYNSNIDRLTPSAHGGINWSELASLGLSPEQMTDFSVSVNPFGPPPGIEAAVCQAVFDRYPDSESTAVRGALAAKLKVAPDRILVGSGSTEIIRLIATACFSHDIVIIPQPTYGEYETACQIVGARVTKPWMLGEPDFRLNVKRLKELIEEHHPIGLFLCNPNNPTGEYLPRDVVNNLLYITAPGLLVLDEAYIAFTESPWDSIELLDTGRLIIVRSMTKDFALPGLRLGYALASNQIISVLNRIKPPWNVSSVAQAAASYVLGQDDYLKSCAQKLRQAGDFLVSGLKSRGFSVVPSDANFFLVKVGDAAGFRRSLLVRRFIVRDCTSFGLPTYIRLAPRTLPECEELLAAIDSPEVMNHVS